MPRLPNRTTLGAGALGALLAGGGILLGQPGEAPEDPEGWAAYAKEHDCRPLVRAASSIDQLELVTNDVGELAWLCKDRRLFWRKQPVATDDGIES